MPRWHTSPFPLHLQQCWKASAHLRGQPEEIEVQTEKKHFLLIHESLHAIHSTNTDYVTMHRQILHVCHGVYYMFRRQIFKSK